MSTGGNWTGISVRIRLEADSALAALRLELPASPWAPGLVHRKMSFWVYQSVPRCTEVNLTVKKRVNLVKKRSSFECSINHLRRAVEDGGQVSCPGGGIQWAGGGEGSAALGRNRRAALAAASSPIAVCFWWGASPRAVCGRARCAALGRPTGSHASKIWKTRIW